MQIIMARAGRKRSPAMHLSERGPKTDYRALCGEQPHRRGLPEGLKLAAEGETPFGRLFLSSQLTGEQHEAGQWYKTIVLAYLASIGSPRDGLPHGKSYPCKGDPQCGQDETLPPCECRARKIAYNGAFEALAEAGHRAQVEVALVAVHGRGCGNLDYLRYGLNMLARHRLTMRRKSSMDNL